MEDFILYSFIYLCIHFSPFWWQERQIIRFLLGIAISLTSNPAQTFGEVAYRAVCQVLTEVMKLMSRSSAVCHIFPTEDSETLSAHFVFVLASVLAGMGSGSASGVWTQNTYPQSTLLLYETGPDLFSNRGSTHYEHSKDIQDIRKGRNFPKDVIFGVKGTQRK